ncbi:hypothetical protein [Enterobacter asburiae]|uniref:hypothetical protein n=1 Tax=Enterobacter asburiae TaxID=61645 RepID=UPI00192B8C75|nr:hypothetical protein [Enterobacter asburiae]MBL5927808.1 hypothetical protein [Enterobacter asburiae]MBL5958595.1 hypothetical protein [Enterobacter asburiae]
MSVTRYGINAQGVFTNLTDGGYVSYQDYEKLAAENAGLKEWSPNPHSASMFEAIEKAERLMDDGMPELAMVEAFEILKMQHTPATDALLAEVRASELDSLAGVAETMLVKFANQGASEIPEAKGWEVVRRQASHRAAQLRKGVQS